MGAIRHSTVIATIPGWIMEGRDDDSPLMDVDGFRASLPEEWQRLLIGPVKSVVNNYYTWVFLPDGSNEGWDTSNRGDVFRAEFIALFKQQLPDGSMPADVIVIDARFHDPHTEPEVVVTSNLSAALFEHLGDDQNN